MCKWLKDEVCVNSDCPAVADFCPVVNHPGMCRYEEMDENKCFEGLTATAGKQKHSKTVAEKRG